MSEQTSFHDLPEDHFPFVVRFFRGDTQVHQIDVTGPGAIVIPALGNITLVRMEFADGSVLERIVTETGP